MLQQPDSTLDGLMAGFQSISAQVMMYLPRVMVAVLVLVLGWLLARLLRLLVVRTIGRLDHLWQRLILKRGSEHLPPRRPPTRVVGEVVFWLVILIFVTLATEITGLSIFGSWLKQAATYLPLAIAGLLIVLVGFVVSSLFRDLVASNAASAGLSQGDLLARTVQVVIMLTAIILGIDQIGIDIMFLSVMVGIILATMLGGLALAFGLGARTHVSNIIAANQLRQRYQDGDIIRIGDIEGRILAITVSRVTIETESGNVDVPAKLFDEQVTVIIEKSS
jgi:hypothetical protein